MRAVKCEISQCTYNSIIKIAIAFIWENISRARKSRQLTESRRELRKWRWRRILAFRMIYRSSSNKYTERLATRASVGYARYGRMLRVYVFARRIVRDSVDGVSVCVIDKSEESTRPNVTTRVEKGQTYTRNDSDDEVMEPRLGFIVGVIHGLLIPPWIFQITMRLSRFAFLSNRINIRSTFTGWPERKKNFGHV